MSDEHKKLVTITLRDPATGKQMQFQCITTNDRISTASIVVDAGYVRDVEAALCER